MERYSTRSGSEMYKVFGSSKDAAFRVVWMLEELGQGYEVEPVRPRSETARAYNPSGKVPILLVDGEPILDFGFPMSSSWPTATAGFTAPPRSYESVRVRTAGRDSQPTIC